MNRWYHNNSEDPTQLLSGTWPAFEVQTIRKEKVHLDHYDGDDDEDDDDGDDDYRDADYHDVKVWAARPIL